MTTRKVALERLTQRANESPEAHGSLGKTGIYKQDQRPNKDERRRQKLKARAAQRKQQRSVEATAPMWDKVERLERKRTERMS